MKRIFLIFLLLSLISLLFASQTILAFAEFEEVDVSSYQSFYDSTIGNRKGYDVNHDEFGVQCFDGAALLWLKACGRTLQCGLDVKSCWYNINNREANAGQEFELIYRKEDIRRGDILVFDNSTSGHIGFAHEDYNGTDFIRLYAQNNHRNRDPFDVISFSLKTFIGGFRYKGWSKGSEMTSGYSRVLPDGDYIIACAGTVDKSRFYVLDIKGTASKAKNGTNVAINGPDLDPEPCDVWTIRYDSEGFYTIKQYGTNMCLDVTAGSVEKGANVQVYQNNGLSPQKWAITYNSSGVRTGYRLQAKCSGYALDVSGGQVNTTGTNVQQWYPVDTSPAQQWMFIPYKPIQPVKEGRYILLYTANRAYELDVVGDTDIIPNNANVQLWEDTALSQYNAFDFIKLSNGYYKIRHAASGKCLDVSDGLTTYGGNVALHDDNGSIAQQWAVIKNAEGYSLIARCNGYALDLADGKTVNGNNIMCYPRLGNAPQTWSLVPAEYTVTYDLNGVFDLTSNIISILSRQTAYYKAPLTLSPYIPTRRGYIFLGWSTSPSATIGEYLPGGTLSGDGDVKLYAVWRSVISVDEPDQITNDDVPEDDTYHLGDILYAAYDGVWVYDSPDYEDSYVGELNGKDAVTILDVYWQWDEVSEENVPWLLVTTPYGKRWVCGWDFVWDPDDAYSYSSDPDDSDDWYGDDYDGEDYDGGIYWWDIDGGFSLYPAHADVGVYDDTPYHAGEIMDYLAEKEPVTVYAVYIISLEDQEIPWLWIQAERDTGWLDGYACALDFLWDPDDPNTIFRLEDLNEFGYIDYDDTDTTISTEPAIDTKHFDNGVFAFDAPESAVISETMGKGKGLIVNMDVSYDAVVGKSHYAVDESRMISRFVLASVNSGYWNSSGLSSVNAESLAKYYYNEFSASKYTEYGVTTVAGKNAYYLKRVYEEDVTPGCRIDYYVQFDNSVILTITTNDFSYAPATEGLNLIISTLNVKVPEGF